jgi:hypothetical protein
VLEAVIKPGDSTSRAGYLRALDEQIGPRPLDERGRPLPWEEEWLELSYETYMMHDKDSYTPKELRCRPAGPNLQPLPSCSADPNSGRCPPALRDRPCPG